MHSDSQNDTSTMIIITFYMPTHLYIYECVHVHRYMSSQHVQMIVNSSCNGHCHMYSHMGTSSKSWCKPSGPHPLYWHWFFKHSIEISSFDQPGLQLSRDHNWAREAWNPCFLRMHQTRPVEVLGCQGEYALSGRLHSLLEKAKLWSSRRPNLNPDN